MSYYSVNQQLGISNPPPIEEPPIPINPEEPPEEPPEPINPPPLDP